MTTITVREYARLTTQIIENNSLDMAFIPVSAFDWICDIQKQWGRKNNSFISVDGSKTLRVNNYVGMLESPCGTRIEILPKIHDAENDINKTREILWKMLCAYIGKDTKEAGQAHVKCMNKPLSEWLIHSFLQELSLLVKRGLHAQYNRINEEKSFIRGRINTTKQMRQPVHKQHLTHICHNIFTVDRPENRLLRTALSYCFNSTRDPQNWALAKILDDTMRQVPQSFSIKSDFQQWQDARHHAHYVPIKPWCFLILNELEPVALHGSWRGLSLLFPMEKIFESFVTHLIRKKIQKGVSLVSQSKKEFLCVHKGSKMFNLQPDILLTSNDNSWVLDAKWKLLNSSSEDKYGISQADMYQLFAYGHKCLNGNGNLALIYPKTNIFTGLEDPFIFSDDMNLYLIACDLEAEIFYPTLAVKEFPISDIVI